PEYCANHFYWRFRKTVVTRPDGTTETSYHQLFNTSPCAVQGWNWYEFALPFARSYSRTDASGDTQYLSTELRDGGGNLLQSQYVRYEGDALLSGPIYDKR